MQRADNSRNLFNTRDSFILIHKFTENPALDTHVGTSLLRMRSTCLECSAYPHPLLSSR